MNKLIIVDTSYLLRNPDIVETKEKETTLVVTPFILNELDTFKNSQGSKGYSARRVSRELLEYLRNSEIITNDIFIFDPDSTQDNVRTDGSLRLLSEADQSVINSAEHFRKLYAERNIDICVATYDNLILMYCYLKGIGILEENPRNYLEEEVPEVILTKSSVVSLRESEVNLSSLIDLDRKKITSAVNNHRLFNVDYKEDGNHRLLCYREDDVVGKVSDFLPDFDNLGLEPKNKEQKYSLYYLLNTHYSLVSLCGAAGTGKTLLALACAMYQVLETSQYEKIIITKPTVPVDGKDIGFFPGDKNEKLMNWMGSIFDNLDTYYSLSKKNKSGSQSMIKYLLDDNRLEFLSIAQSRGVSKTKSIILVDDAQNLTIKQIKTLVTRVGEGSKIVFLGDINQIDSHTMSFFDKGIVHMHKKLRPYSFFGKVLLKNSERSELARVAGEVL